jgi:Rrf2 family protein
LLSRRRRGLEFDVLTAKGKYGLKAMVHLAGLEAGQPALAARIAAEEGIPKKFLDAILGELRNAGLIAAKKGKGGGYALAKPAYIILVSDIIRALDGPLAPYRCVSQNFYARCPDCDEATCAVRLVMTDVRRAITGVLENRTLADMRAAADLDADALMFHI